MTNKNDLILLIILALGAIFINWKTFLGIFQNHAPQSRHQPSAVRKTPMVSAKLEEEEVLQ